MRTIKKKQKKQTIFFIFISFAFTHQMCRKITLTISFAFVFACLAVLFSTYLRTSAGNAVRTWEELGEFHRLAENAPTEEARAATIRKIDDTFRQAHSSAIVILNYAAIVSYLMIASTLCTCSFWLLNGQPRVVPPPIDLGKVKLTK